MWKLFKRVVFILIVVNISSIMWGRFFNPPITFIQLEGLIKYRKLHRDYISFDEMGSLVKRAVIASEDQNYFRHNGFDFKAIRRAMINNQKNDKKRLQGGSTISQQTAKNIFLWNGRSWVRKGVETIFTFMIENFWNKEIILERYLNSIEMGQGVFGVEAASKYYFGKSAKNLNKSEAAWIAAVLPNPKKYDPKNPSPYLKKKHEWIMKQMRDVRLN
ncbi:monofunctional biosynthetic peptidoglycan transglycosylase [Elizabethkingia argentiflava]|uniref:Biosynthetic peptidoglycan transglycosylase n=1 Tax=Elizabethkingia argenteiflava TaxID=2681556 RepID=A0A845PYV6_9FLAO|nr:monofunctional biosynthetic peptidoglycan transglycosylase [Elizabethkingia argenteiflava]NAW51627.1 monofunctional biosynthetic peptidoglycan transglycosylase [Elizabethkingia argenteiflava]